MHRCIGLSAAIGVLNTENHVPKHDASFALCSFSVENGVLFMQMKSGFRIRVSIVTVRKRVKV